MTKALLSAIAIGIGLTLPATAATEGEFDGECVMGLALGKEIKTDCSVSTVYGGKTYCFGNETAKRTLPQEARRVSPQGANLLFQQAAIRMSFPRRRLWHLSSCSS